VNRYELLRAFGWAVSDPDEPSATWWFELEEEESGVRLRQCARRRVPVEIGLRSNLVGTDEVVGDRLRLYRDVGITTLRVSFTEATGLEAQLDALGHLADLVADVNEEASARDAG
jgi:hypothetical protein